MWWGRDAGPYFVPWGGQMTGVVALSPGRETLQEVHQEWGCLVAPPHGCGGGGSTLKWC